MNRDTLEVALVEVNRRRGHHHRAIAELEARLARRLVEHRPGVTDRAIRSHRRELVRLDAAHGDLAVELVLLKAAQADRPFVDPSYPAGGRVPQVDA